MIRALALTLLLAAPVRASVAKNVVLVTLDGVRWQEFFSNAPDAQLSTDVKPVLPKLWARENEGVILGDAAQGSSMSVNNFAVLSLPAYQSIMAGRMTGCLKNECGRTKAETLVERLSIDLSLSAAEMSVVSGWSNVPLAVERTVGHATIDAPAKGSRKDADTWAAGKAALQKKPRFLWIAFNDPDDRAHADDYAGYVNAIRLCDGWLDELFAWLDASGEYGAQTAVLVTTDHGRGEGKDYTSHGGRATAMRVWLYARGAGINTGGRPGKVADAGHVNIRPTIEKLLGLQPSGTALPAVLAP